MEAPRNCAVSPDGDSIALSLPDRHREWHDIVLTFGEASSLAMTLPRLLKMALQQKYSDSTVRLVFPLREYAVECSRDLQHLILTLAAADGFDVVFSLSVEMLIAFARDLADGGKTLAKQPSTLPN